MRTMRRRTLLQNAALVGTGLTAGCLSSGRKPPVDQVEMTLRDVRQPELGVTSATIPLIVGFYNPTDRAIPDPTAELNLYVSGARVASSETSFDTLEAGERTEATVDVIVQYSGISASVENTLRSGSFRVRVRGRLRSKSESAPVSGSYAV